MKDFPGLWNSNDQFILHYENGYQKSDRNLSLFRNGTMKPLQSIDNGESQKPKRLFMAKRIKAD